MRWTASTTRRSTGYFMACSLGWATDSPGKGLTLVGEFIYANEPGLAIEQIADVLCDNELPLTADGRADMVALAGHLMATPLPAESRPAAH